MAEPAILRFWRWAYAYAGTMVRQHYMHIYKHDRKCPNCGRWGAIGGFNWSELRRIDDWHDGLTCTSCGHESWWFMGSMLPILAEPEYYADRPTPDAAR